MHLRARRYHKSRSAFLCLSFFCVTLLREALVYFTPFTPLTVYSVCDSELLRCQSSKRAKLYVPKSRNLADSPAVKQLKLINRQLSSLTGNLTCLRAFRVTQF